MGWGLGYDDRRERFIGYAVPAYCDHPNCNAEIDRGLSYVCGGEPYGGEHGCGLYFCGHHLAYYTETRSQSCKRCGTYKRPYTPKPEHPTWLRHLLTDESWAQWRDENQNRVAAMRAALEAAAGSVVLAVDPASARERIHGPPLTRQVLMPHDLTPSADTGGAAETAWWTLERYELLRQAVNEFGDQECDAACDSYGHTETCPNCDPARWFVDQQREVHRLRARLAESETALREIADERTSDPEYYGEEYSTTIARLQKIARAALTPPEPT